MATTGTDEPKEVCPRCGPTCSYHQIDCPCQTWASMDLAYLRSNGTLHHPDCDGKGGNKDFVQWTSTPYKPEPSLQLLVIDLGHSVLMSHESGREFRFEMPSGREFVFNETCDQYLTRDFSFTELREAIDSQDKPVPRIERPTNGNYTLYVGNVTKPYSFELPFEAKDALSELAGKPLPIYTPTDGKWERLNTHDWSQAKKDAGEAGYGINTHSFEEAVCPVKVWRYTR